MHLVTSHPKDSFSLWLLLIAFDFMLKIDTVCTRCVFFPSASHFKLKLFHGKVHVFFCSKFTLQIQNHRIIESQGWKGPTRSSCPTVLSPTVLNMPFFLPYLINMANLFAAILLSEELHVQDKCSFKAEETSE